MVLKLKSPIEVTFGTLKVQTVLHFFAEIGVFTREYSHPKQFLLYFHMESRFSAREKCARIF